MTSNVEHAGPLAGASPARAWQVAGWSVTPRAVEALRVGFPGAAVAGVCLVVAPLLAVVGSALGIDIYHAKGAAFVAGMVAHPDRMNLAIQLALAAMVLMVFAVAGLATMISASRPGWGRTAGVVTVVGLCGPISFESTYWGAWHLLGSGAQRAAAAHMIDQSQIIPRTIMNVSGPALVVGFLLLAIGAARAGVLRRPQAVFLGLTCVVPAGFISGHLVIAVIAFAACAVATVPLGVGLLRRT
ncbi:hypothetical protein [Nocardioides terrisoli]|uniref:hypothetical protein n=1 Tax=Nocardioides terrisoli TaxID=3388267 RepID=UPI00287B6AFD|nr:hypothetical protein [Nocardioides marmorisolisilvae]